MYVGLVGSYGNTNATKWCLVLSSNSTGIGLECVVSSGYYQLCQSFLPTLCSLNRPFFSHNAYMLSFVCVCVCVLDSAFGSSHLVSWGKVMHGQLHDGI